MELNSTQKIKIYIGGSFNNVESAVIKKPHKFNNKLKEADFILLDSDLDLLKDCITPDVFIVYNNGDSTFKPRCATISSHKYPNRLTSSVDDILAGLKHNVGRCNFKHYMELYLQALNVIIDEKHIPSHINMMAEETGISTDVLMEFTSKNQAKEQVRKGFEYCYVYLMHDKRNGYHKIGISKEPKYREKTLQSEQPAIEMICNKRYPSRKIVEAIEFALHKAYAEQRVRGEWFDLSPEDVIMLKESLT